MGSLIPAPELTLDCSPSSELWFPKTIGGFLADVSRIHNVSEKLLKLDDYVSRLQDEMKKIEAFKRELPLCMLLLNDAIARMKEELIQCKKTNAEPVLEEFMPLKKSNSDEEDEKNINGDKKNEIINSREKMNWMSSVQLWNSDNQQNHTNTENFSNYKLPTTKLDNNKKRKEEVINRPPAMDDLFPSSKNRAAAGRAFSSFKGCGNFPVMTMGKEPMDELPGAPSLSLRTPEIKNPKDEICSNGFSPKSSSSRSGSSSATNVQSNFKTVQQQSSARKQRRCWSPELHRRFVSALQHLGGAQVATPKQIRELMQVDGLTNDEVKSHLQKYRLHTRRAPNTTNTTTATTTATTSTTTTQPILGGLWMSQEQCNKSSKQSLSQSGSPEGPLHLNGSSRATSMTGGDSLEDEDEDDEKSESHSWKSSHNV